MVPKPHFQKIMKIKNIYQNRFVVESLTCVGDAVSNNEFEVCNNACKDFSVAEIKPDDSTPKCTFWSMAIKRALKNKGIVHSFLSLLFLFNSEPRARRK